MLMTFEVRLMHTATIYHPGAVIEDAHFNEVPGEDADPPQDCLLQPSGGREVETGRDTVISDWDLFLLPTARIDARCRVVVDGTGWAEVDGKSFAVVGDPLRHSDAEAPHHIEARLRAWEG
jgi:hypothetical protein